ncbi:MAG: hypothetical protein FVQ79_00345 [Planctomycetes bacterium]|nr:hypothetical protein [Planctomycetota bacterium]
MKEFPFIIAESLSRGLRPEDTYLNKEGYLEECLNMKPNPGGLVSYEAPTDPFSGGQVVDFPFPQFVRGQELTLLFDKTAVYELATGSIPWTKTILSLNSPSLPSSTSLITQDGVWHFVDLGPAFYAFNGSSTVFRTGLDRLESSASSSTYVTDSVTISTGCEHKGRVYIGGLDQSNVWNKLWQEVFAQWEKEAGLKEIDLIANGPDINWVMWSSIGGGDFPLWLLYPSGFGQLNLGPSKEFVLEKLRRNEFGWKPMKFEGQVHVLKPLGDFVVAYGADGIEALEPRGPDMGFRTIAQFGVLGRGAVGGDINGHVFIAQDGELWGLSPTLELVRFGYKEWFSGFSSVSTAITLNPVWREFFLSDPDTSYIFHPQNGLNEIQDRITSSTYFNGVHYALASSGASTSIRVLTGAHDNDRQALKFIHNIQVQYQDITNLTIELLFRYNSTSAFSSLGPTSVSPSGIVTFSCTALEFKVRLRGTPGSNPRIDRLEVRWSLVDKRAVRGLFGTEQ